MGCICAVEEGSHHLAHSQQPNYQAQAVPHAMVTKAAVICCSGRMQCTPVPLSNQDLVPEIASLDTGFIVKRTVVSGHRRHQRTVQAHPSLPTHYDHLDDDIHNVGPCPSQHVCEEVGSLSRQLLSPGPSERGHEVGEGWWACQRCSDQLRRQETGLCMQPCTVLSAGRQHCSNLWSGVVHGADWWKIHVQFVPVLCLVHVGESSEPVGRTVLPQEIPRNAHGRLRELTIL